MDTNILFFDVKDLNIKKIKGDEENLEFKTNTLLPHSNILGD